LGFGAAMDGKFREYEGIVLDGVFPAHLVALQETIWVFQAALERCLVSAGMTNRDIDVVIPQFEPAGLIDGMMRLLRLPMDLLAEVEGRPTHTGPFDWLFALEAAAAKRSKGQRLLVTSRATGLAVFALISL
jgi:3-oxoacyl-[acyl-carrier-protein] synthase III